MGHRSQGAVLDSVQDSVEAADELETTEADANNSASAAFHVDCLMHVFFNLDP